ncbi:MAG: HAD hydrolase-like protein [Coleofasciculaceae cyanobacterium]
MSVNVIIFDFDGTLADTFEAIVGITNNLAVEFGYKPATPEEIIQVRNLSSREIVKQSGISVFKLPFLLKRVKENLHNDIQNLNPVLGIKEALTQLKEKGYILGILTSNSEENVGVFLRKHEMKELFSFVHSAKTLFGKHTALKKLMSSYQWNAEEVVYVGDETRDIESSQKINLKVIAVSWGFNSKIALAEQKPDFIIDHPSELVDLIESLQQVLI